MPAFIHVNDLLIAADKVTHLWQDQAKGTVTIYFINGQEQVFNGDEAVELWRAFDPDPGWRAKDEK